MPQDWYAFQASSWPLSKPHAHCFSGAALSQFLFFLSFQLALSYSPQVEALFTKGVLAADNHGRKGSKYQTIISQGIQIR